MISCDCSVDTSEFDAIRCITTEIRTARKSYECCECDEGIKPGKKYEHSSGIDHHGDPFRFRTCLPCSRIRKHYCPNGYIWGDLAETIRDCIGFDYRTIPTGDGGEYDGDVEVERKNR